MLTQREDGALSMAHKGMSLPGRWREKNDKSSSTDAEDNGLAQELMPDRLVQLEVGKGQEASVCYVSAPGKYPKTYTKWYPDNESMTWATTIGKGKCRVSASMVTFDHCCGRYKEVYLIAEVSPPRD